jgi:penicillin-insensitive murein DD-endopeptidase
MRLIKRAASYPALERIFVYPAIKKALCEMASGDRSWLRKVRPWWGHHYHFHVRLSCPRGSPGCEPQPPVPADDGCGADLDHWYGLLRKAEEGARRPPKPGAKPPPAKLPMRLAELPAECRSVLSAGTDAPLAADGTVLRSKTSLVTKDAGVPIPRPPGLGIEASMAGTPLPDRKPN